MNWDMSDKNDKKAKGPLAKRSAKKGTTASPVVSLPAWPILKPLLPAIDLELESLLQDQVFVIRRLFTAALCKKYVTFLAALPLATTPNQPKKGEALRVNDRYQVVDPSFAELLFTSTGLKQLIKDSGYKWGPGDVYGLNPNIRIYRYSKGQFFDKHCKSHSLLKLGISVQCGLNFLSLNLRETPLSTLDDDDNVVNIASEPPVKTRTTWTLLLYLTGASTGCVGGETVFHLDSDQLHPSRGHGKGESQVLSVAPEVGMALLHKHGNDCLLHEGRKVVSGEKWIIRSDLCVKV